MPVPKVTLISPYPDVYAFGIRMLSAVLKKEGYDVQVILLPNDFHTRYDETVLSQVACIAKGSCLIGISLMANFFDNVVQLTKYLKQHVGAPVLWGGIHPTVRPVECLEYADLVCVGEGEEAIVKLLAKISNKADYRAVGNIWMKDGDKIIKNEIRPFIEDLDTLPFPDYDYETHHMLVGNDIRLMDQSLFEQHTNGCYVTMPTRGCPFSCSYCCNNVLKKLYPGQRTLRKRSPENIVAELSLMKRKMPFMRLIQFDDDAFFSYSLEETEEFCGKYRAENIGLPLHIGGATPSTVSTKRMRLLIDTGLTHVRMGIQTASDRIRELYNRNYSNQDVKKAINIIDEFAELKSINRLTQYDIILDNPWETEADLIETLLFLTEIPAPYNLAFFSLTFYPGTDLYLKAKKDGIVVDDINDIYRKHYHRCADTYLNRLFILLGRYAIWGGRIPTTLMRCLVNKGLRNLGVSQTLYSALSVWVFVFNKTQRSLYLLRESLKDIGKGDWSRIASRGKKLFSW